MEKEFPIALIKIGKKKFMNDLISKGKLRLNTINYYRNHENKEIGDSWENPKKVQQGIISLFNEKNNDFIELSKEPLPICESNNELNGNVYCMFGIKLSDFKIIEDYYVFEISHELIKEFGGTVVFFPQPELFLEKLEQLFLSKGYNYESQFVNYFDPKIDSELNVFNKRKTYKHQSEYRIFIKNNKDKILDIELGSLKKMTYCISKKCMIKMILNHKDYIIKFY